MTYRNTKIYIKYVLINRKLSIVIEDEERQICISIFILFPIMRLCDCSYDYMHVYSKLSRNRNCYLKIDKKKKNAFDCNGSIVVILLSRLST